MEATSEFVLYNMEVRERHIRKIEELLTGLINQKTYSKSEKKEKSKLTSKKLDGLYPRMV